jgi:hypothetical protein
MPIFSSLDQWRPNPETGDVDMRFKTPDGKVFEASFQREMIPALLVRMHQMLSGTVDQFPRGLKELTEAYIPVGASLQALPNADLAMFLETQTGMQVPIHLTLETCDNLLQLLGEARSILAAEQAPGVDGATH